MHSGDTQYRKGGEDLRAEWGGRILFSHGTSQARGVCILFRRDFFCNIQNVSTDYAGRVVCCEIDTDSQHDKITLCAIYGPNQDSPAFFDAIAQRLEDYTENVIVLGDFNLVMEPVKDRHKSLQNNNKARCVLEEICNTLSLTDVWRVRNENVTRYSWMRSGRNFSASRIDFALTNLNNIINNCCYLQSILTDHSAFYISVEDATSTEEEVIGNLMCDSSMTKCVVIK